VARERSQNVAHGVVHLKALEHAKELPLFEAEVGLHHRGESVEVAEPVAR